MASPCLPQVKNTVTFKTLTYEIFLLGLLSTLFLLSHDTDNVTESNNTYILIVLNLVNIVSNIFLLSYLFHNQEAVEFTKKKNQVEMEQLQRMFRRNKISPSKKEMPKSVKIFTIRTPQRESLIQFNNDIELVEMDSCSQQD